MMAVCHLVLIAAIAADTATPDITATTLTRAVPVVAEAEVGCMLVVLPVLACHRCPTPAQTTTLAYTTIMRLVRPIVKRSSGSANVVIIGV